MVLLFYEAQRSGKLPKDQRVQWRADSCLSDGSLQQVDLVGGYYDAGDHIKFGLPMAFSITLLSWAAVDFKQDLVATNQMEHTLQAIQWGTDYFLKAHCDHNALWVQVGDGEADHKCWQRAEDLVGPRTAFKVDSTHPGSDVVGETAAALAAASLAFQPYNCSYADTLLLHAKQLFSFADTFRGKYDDSVPAAKSFYPSTGYSDELLWAAAWLYRATNNDYYLQYASGNGADLGGTGNSVKMFSWDNKYAGLQVLLSKVLLDGNGGSFTNTLKQYKAKADYFACAYMQKNSGYNVPRTPGGLAFLLASNNMQYAASASFLLAIYSDYLTHSSSDVDCPDGKLQPQDLINFAKSQADYILGKNPQSMSYVVGFGPKYPQKAHHRGSSIPSIHEYTTMLNCDQGFDQWYRNPGPNPNILYGGLLGGPDSSDDFCDERDNYDQSEPTLTAAAPLIGLFSKLQSLACSSPPNGYSSPNMPPPSYSSPSTPPQSSYQNQNPTAPNTPLVSPEISPPLPNTPTIEESPVTQPSPSEHLSATPAPASSPNYAPAPSPEADYELISQPLNSAISTREEGLKYLVLKAMLFLMPLLGIL